MRKLMNPFLFLGIVVLVNCQNGTETGRNQSAEAGKTERIPAGRSLAYRFVACVQIRDASCMLDVAHTFLETEQKAMIIQTGRALSLAHKGRAKADDEEDEGTSAISDTIGQLVSELTDIVKEGITGLFRDTEDGKSEGAEQEKDENDAEEEADEDETDDDENENEDGEKESKQIVGRSGKKKKKIKKMIYFAKLLVIGAVVATKLIIVLKIFAAHLQVKFLLIAVANLALNAGRLYVDLRRGGGLGLLRNAAATQAAPQRVIHYEHAHHNHHYENEDEELVNAPGELPNSYGKSYEVVDGGQQQVAYSRHRPQYANPGGSYHNYDDSYSFWGR